MNPILHKVISVQNTAESGVYIIKIDLTDMEGERYVADYCLRPEDTFGLAPELSQMIKGYKGKILDYVKPTDKEIRSNLHPLSRKQFRLMLLKFKITSEDVATLISKIKDAQPSEIAKIEWEDGTSFSRMDPLTEMISKQFKLSDAKVDAAWIDAQSL